MQKQRTIISPDTGDIFSRIREGFRFVASQSSHVRIRHDRLEQYALSLPMKPEGDVLDDDHHYTTSDDEARAAYILVLDAVNFGSGYKRDLIAEGWPIVSGSIYYTVSTALKESFERGGPWTAERMSIMMPDEISATFRFPAGPKGKELAGLFTTAIRELGTYILHEHEGRFMDFVGGCQGQAGKLVSGLATLPGFNDVHMYRGVEVPILKRAQIAAADLHLAFAHAGKVLFHDIERLTMFADNAVPHVLRIDQILAYDETLAQEIDQGAFIPEGSEREIELRCCAGEVVEQIAAIKDMNAMNVDHILWHRKREGRQYQSKLAHNTLSRFY